MAKVQNNIITQGLSGKLGDQIVFRTGKNGQTIVAVKPSYDPNRGMTSGQIAHQEAFRQAIAYAKTARTDAVYISKAQGTALSAYNVAVSDWFNKPEMLEININGWTGAVGHTLRFKAQDDVQVVKVSVAIKNGSGLNIDQGEAVKEDGLWWTYTTKQSVPPDIMPDASIVATAHDLAGNTDEMSWHGS